MFGVDELGLDLGTSTLHMVVRGKGIVLSEPAYVAYDRQTRNVVAVGEEARRMYGRTPAGLIVERPMRDGRIRSFDLVSKMLRYFLRKVVGKRATFRPKLLLALPGGMAPSERQTLVDVIVDAGVRSVVPVDEGVASAIGAGMRIDQPYHCDLPEHKKSVSNHPFRKHEPPHETLTSHNCPHFRWNNY